MFDRREALKSILGSLGVAAVVPTVMSASTEQPVVKLLPLATNRTQNYKRCEEIYKTLSSSDLNQISEYTTNLFYSLLDLNPHKHIITSLARIIQDSIIYGDYFLEKVSDQGKIVSFLSLARETVFRIETIRGKLIEFQQSLEGPDYQAMVKFDINKATEAELQSGTNVRFKPNEIIHIRPKTRMCYGTSAIITGRLILDAETRLDLSNSLIELIEEFNESQDM